MNLSNRAIAALCSLFVLVGCAEQQRSLSGTSAQYLNVEGKRIMVRVAPMDAPGEYRVLAVRDAVVIDPDRERERGFSVQEEGMLDNINYFARFRCGA